MDGLKTMEIIYKSNYTHNNIMYIWLYDYLIITNLTLGSQWYTQCHLTSQLAS